MSMEARSRSPAHLPMLSPSGSAPSLLSPSASLSRGRTADGPRPTSKGSQVSSLHRAGASSTFGSSWNPGSSSKKGLFGVPRDLASMPPPSLHVPWKQFHVSVRAGTRTLAERLADRERDSERDREEDVDPFQLSLGRSFGGSRSSGALGSKMRRAWSSSSSTKYEGISPRVSDMLRETEKVQRLFQPAPLEDQPQQPPPKGQQAPGTPKSGAKVFKPTARSSLSITKGCRLAQLIESGCIGLVRSSYFEDCMLHNRPLSMRQLIPNSFMWRGDEAVNLWWRHGKCFLCIVSYAWLSKDHPDPNQLHLRKLVRILEEYKKIWNVHEVAVILDYCSLWQRSARGDTRTSEQKEQFNQGFREINVAYAHKAITSIKLTEVPPEEPRKYDDRGWTLMESILIDAKGGDWNRWTFNDFDPESTQWPDSVVFFMQAKTLKLRPPLTPQGFVRELEQRRLRSKSRDMALFSNERDNEEVPKRYEDVFMQIVNSTKLSYDNADWSDDEVMLMLEVVASCNRLEKLQLNNNRINLQGASEIAKLIPQLPNLKFLGLKGNPLCRDSQATDLLRLVWSREKKPVRNLEM